jgi:hypothetical protein
MMIRRNVRGSDFLFHRFFQLTSCREFGHLPGQNLDGGPGLGVATHSRFPLRNGKSSEADDRDLLTLLQRGRNSPHHGIERGFGFAFADSGVLRNLSYQLAFVQGILLLPQSRFIFAGTRH